MKKILIVALCCLCLCGCENESKIESNTNNNDNSNNVENKEQNNQSTQKKKFKMNEDLIVTNSSGQYRIKFTSVTETSDRNQFSQKRADRVVIVEYEYENISLNDDLYISSSNFKLYDKDNNAIETYPAGKIKYPSDISTGRKTTASEAFALNNVNNYIELEYYDNMFGSKAIGIIILEW